MECNIDERTERKVHILNGTDITFEIFEKLQKIESEGQAKELMRFQGVRYIKELMRMQKGSNLIIGEDWFLVYLCGTTNIYVCNMVKGNIRFDDEEIYRQLEMYKGLLLILKESIEKSIHSIMAILREDTSYQIYLSALENELIEPVSGDKRYKYGSNVNFMKRVKIAIRTMNQENKTPIYLHEVEFMPTSKAIPQIERRVGKIMRDIDFF